MPSPGKSATSTGNAMNGAMIYVQHNPAGGFRVIIYSEMRRAEKKFTDHADALAYATTKMGKRGTVIDEVSAAGHPARRP